MGTKNRQAQIQTQKLTPQQILQANIMQLNSSLLEQRIIKELEENPTLEIIEEADSIENSEDEDIISEEKDEETDFDWDELDADSDRFELKKDKPELSSDYLFNNHTSPKTLIDKVKEQLLDINIPEDKMHIANEIVGNLDVDGYFKIEPILIADRLQVDEQEVLAMLSVIQSLEPRGIASRNLKECMLLQIDSDKHPLAYNVIENHFEDFSKKRFEAICSSLDCSLDELNDANEVITKTNPKPGDGISSFEEEFIIPDIIVEKRSEQWAIHMNDSSMYELKVSDDYTKMLSDKSVDKKTSSFIKSKLDTANWFIDAINQRKRTILNVMNVIINKQKNIFLHEKQELIPMVLKDIADELEIDISTVSRATKDKYVQLPWGIFELRDFFSESIKTTSGEEVSNTIIKNRIKEIIDKEDKSKPMDDQEITDILTKQGYLIARRTVSKYRAIAGFPKSKLRREII